MTVGTSSSFVGSAFGIVTEMTGGSALGVSTPSSTDLEEMLLSVGGGEVIVAWSLRDNEFSEAFFSRGLEGSVGERGAEVDGV